MCPECTKICKKKENVWNCFRYLLLGVLYEKKKSVIIISLKQSILICAYVLVRCRKVYKYGRPVFFREITF